MATVADEWGAKAFPPSVAKSGSEIECRHFGRDFRIAQITAVRELTATRRIRTAIDRARCACYSMALSHFQSSMAMTISFQAMIKWRDLNMGASGAVRLWMFRMAPMRRSLTGMTS